MINNTHHVPSSFITWAKNQKILFIWVIFISLMTYGIKIITYNISIDTDIMMYNTIGSLKAYISSRRFAVSFTKMLLSTEIVNPFLLNFLMVSILGLATIIWSFFLNTLSGNFNSFSNCIFSGIFLTHPLMAEQFEFTLQGTEVALSLLIMVPAVYCIYKYLILNGKKIYLVIGIISMIWCFGTYQSFLIIYILGCIITIIFSLNAKKQDSWHWIKIIIFEIIILIISTILYLSVSAVVMSLFDAYGTYIDSMIMWKTLPVSDCLHNIWMFTKMVICGDNTFYNKLYVLLVVLFIIHYLSRQGNNKIIYLICWIGIFICPFLMSIVLGNQEPKRAQFYLPFMLAFGYYYLSVQITSKKIHIILCSLCLILSFKQGVITSRLFYTDYLRFEDDKNLVYSMAQKMGELGFLSGERKYIVFIGEHHARLNNSAEYGQIIGTSRFNTGAPPTGVTPNAISLFRAFGYDFWPPENEQYEKAIEWSKAMSCWPENGSIYYQDGIIVVKLSEIE